MRMFLLAALGAVALTSLPAEASHRHFYGPYLGFGYGFYSPYSYYSPWYGPHFGVGIRLGDRYPDAARAHHRAQRAARAEAVRLSGGRPERNADVRRSLPMPRLGRR